MPLPDDFCAYSLTNIRAFTQNGVYNGQIEMSFQKDDGTTYECFNGYFTEVLNASKNLFSHEWDDETIKANI